MKAKVVCAVAIAVLLLGCSGDEQRVANLTTDRKVIRVLVVGDAFTKDEESEFNTALDDAKKGFKRLERTTDVSFDITPAFIKGAVLGKSSLGISYNGKPEKCYFRFESAIPNIHAQGKGYDYYFVIFAQSGMGGGCAIGKTMVVEFNASDNTVAHEAGHSVIGLYDELGGIDSTPPQIDPTNCSTTSVNPPWQAQIVSGQLKPPLGGCRHYDALFRPSDRCRMRTTAEVNLCPRCELLVMETMSRRAAAPPVAQQFLARDGTPGRDAADSIDVVALLTSDGKLKVLDANLVDAREVPAPVIVGETFAVVDANVNLDDPRRVIVAITPLAIDDGQPVTLSTRDYPEMLDRRLDLRARSYVPHREELLVPVDGMLIRLTLVGVKAEEVEARDLKVTLRRLSAPGRGELVSAGTRTRLSGASLEGAVVDLSAPLAFYLASK